MIGYGPDISDGPVNKNDDDDPSFHPLPPPITTKGKMATVTS